MKNIYLIPGTYPWTKDPAAALVMVGIVAQGGGGASGARGASSVLGGGPGAGGAALCYMFDGAQIGPTGTVVVGAGGIGGLGRATDGPGLTGAAGLVTCSFTDSLGLTISVPPAPPGTAAAQGVSQPGYSLAGAAGAAPTIVAPGKGGSPPFPSNSGTIAGCAGGSITAAVAPGDGGDILRGVGIVTLLPSILGGLGSAIASGAPGQDGGDLLGKLIYFLNGGTPAGNAGGGGGGASTFAGGNGGKGGTGGSPGGGGGGGGACISGTSGAGGDGAPGAVVIIQLK